MCSAVNAVMFINVTDTGILEFLRNQMGESSEQGIQATYGLSLFIMMSGE